MSAFRLGRLLELTVKEEDNCLYACRHAEARRQAVQHRLQSLLHAVTLAGPTAGNWVSDDLRSCWVYREALGEKAKSERQALQEAEIAYMQAWEAYAQARQRRKMLESLEAKHEARQKAERLRKEQDALDEAGLRKFWQGSSTFPKKT